MSGKSPRNHERNRLTNDGDGVPDGEDICDIVIDLDLEGVRRDVLQSLSIGEKLTLQREPVRGYAAVVCVRSDGAKVGAIGNFKKHAALLNCLERGVRYVVSVTEMRPGGCHVIGGRVS
jgi:hypothetical protein